MNVRLADKIQLPVNAKGKPGKWMNVLERMRTQQSFKVHDCELDRLYHDIRHFRANQPGSYFTIRQMQDGSLRCWRVA